MLAWGDQACILGQEEKRGGYAFWRGLNLSHGADFFPYRLPRVIRCKGCGLAAGMRVEKHKEFSPSVRAEAP